MSKLSEEEIIERLDYFEPDDLVECAMYRDCVEKIKKLIKSQQKEKEKNKKIFNQYEKRVNELEREIGTNCISKDKIKEKIEFYKRYGKIKNSDEYVMSVEIEILEELLGE